MGKRYVVTVTTNDKRLAVAAFRFFTGDDKPDDVEVSLDEVDLNVVERIR